MKDVNIFEQHVEKIVLAIAAAGALWLGWMAIQPIEVAPGVAAGDLEDKAADAVKSMTATEEANKTPKPDPTATANRNYAAEYRRIINDQPLDPNQGSLKAFLPGVVPQLAPVNMAVRASGPKDPGIGDMKAVVPTAVAPELVTAEAWQQPIADVPPSPTGEPVQPLQPSPDGRPQTYPTKDQNAVLIQGYIPAGRMQAEMDANKNRNERIQPDQLRKVSIYRIQVQRRERTATGFTDWKDVTPAPTTPPTTNIQFDGDVTPDPLQSMGITESEFKQIVLPDFHLDPTGAPNTPPILKNPPRRDAADRAKQLQDEINKINSTPSPAGRGPGPNMFRPTPPPGEEVPAEAAPGNPQLSADVAQVRSQSLLPFAFWDDHVEAGHEYQYQVRVAYINPLFKWTYGAKVPALVKEPLLFSSWTLIPQPVVIHSDIAFFVMSSSNANTPTQKVSIWVFKLTGGKWYRGDFDAMQGAPIAGTIRMFDQGDKPIDVDTGYKVVDFTTSGDNVHAVLLDPTGKLTTRDSSADRSDPERDRLLKASVQRVAPPKPTTQPGANPGPVNPAARLGRDPRNPGGE